MHIGASEFETNDLNERHVTNRHFSVDDESSAVLVFRCPLLGDVKGADEIGFPLVQLVFQCIRHLKP